LDSAYGGFDDVQRIHRTLRDCRDLVVQCVQARAPSGHDLVPREMKFLALTLEDGQLDVDALLFGPFDCHMDTWEAAGLCFAVTAPAVDRTDLRATAI